MENPSITLNQQSVVFDPALDKTPSAANIAAVSAYSAKDGTRCPVLPQYFGISRDKAAAVIISIFAHVVLAAILLPAYWHPSLPLFHERSNVIHVTWTDAIALQQMKTHRTPPVASSETVQKIHELEKKQITANKAITASPTGKIAPALTPGQVERESNVSEAGFLTSGISHADLTINPKAGPSKTLQAPGEESLASYTSVAKPRYRENIPPYYPSSERMNGHEGAVIISAVVLAEGRAANLQIKTSSGYRLLDQAALDAVKEWKFDPATKNGKAVSMRVDIPIRFTLKKSN